MIFDAVVIFALLFSSVLAFLRGFIREVLTIVGLLVGGAAALVFGPHMVAPMTRWLGEKAAHDYKFFGLIHGDLMAQALSYCAIFFPLLIVISIASYFLAAGAKAAGLGALDRTLGVVFGIARALVMLSILYMPLYLWTDKADRDKMSFLADSHTRVYIETVSGWMVAMTPDSMLAGLKKDAESAAKDSKTARQTLQDIDVLRKDGKDVQAVPSPVPAGQPSPGAGYQDQQRQDMGKLITKGLNQ